mgnify:CR=1 FL=1
MTSLKSTDNNFWHNPPWGHGREKFRLGLRPVKHSEWFASDISKELHAYKQDLLKSGYSDVIAATEDSVEAQNLLAKKLNITKKIIQTWWLIFLFQCRMICVLFNAKAIKDY